MAIPASLGEIKNWGELTELVVNLLGGIATYEVLVSVNSRETAAALFYPLCWKLTYDIGYCGKSIKLSFDTFGLSFFTTFLFPYVS